jgi:hypothetical protein
MGEALHAFAVVEDRSVTVDQVGGITHRDHRVVRDPGVRNNCQGRGGTENRGEQDGERRPAHAGHRALCYGGKEPGKPVRIMQEEAAMARRFFAFGSERHKESIV